MAVTLLLAGATGLVGRHLLAAALSDERIDRVRALVRRPLLAAPGLESLVVDFEQLPDHRDAWRADVAICALGTTLKRAGSQDAFRRVDHDMVVNVARLARRHGIGAFGLVSAMGADSRSWFFYNRVKGEAEASVRALDFPSLTIARPGLIGGARDEARPLEAAAQTVLGVLGPVLPRRMRINPAHRIAGVLLDRVLRARPGVTVVGSSDMA